MEYSVPTMSIVFMAIVALTSIAIPIVLFTLLQKNIEDVKLLCTMGCFKW